MLNQEFCNFLEYYLTEALTKSTEKDIRRCWCDGILMPESENEYSIEHVINTNKIILNVWIDEGKIKGHERGQFIYELTINFSFKSLKLYSEGKDLIKSLPSKENDDWICLNRQKRKIEIQLL